MPAARLFAAWPPLFRRTPWSLVALLWPLAVAAQPAAPASSPARAGLDAGAWVERIRLAAAQRSYVGILVFTAGQVVSTSRVARMGPADQVIERVEALDGRQQRSIRQNDRVHTIWPDQRLVTIERRGAVDEAAGLPELDPRLQQHYELRMIATERLAGREASVLLLKPKDDWRFTQRLWADQATGLLLRADVLSAQGQILESSAFSDIEIDARLAREPLLNPLKRLDGYRVVQIQSEPATLEADGWVVERLPAGFRLLGCVRRPVGDPGLDVGKEPSRALQAVFSDGLARVSLFIEATDPARQRQALLTHLGATHTLMKPRDSQWWVTVMGDVPAATLKAFADGLGRSKP